MAAAAVRRMMGSASGKSAMVMIPPPTAQADTSSANSAAVVGVALVDMDEIFSFGHIARVLRVYLYDPRRRRYVTDG